MGVVMLKQIFRIIEYLALGVMLLMVLLIAGLAVRRSIPTSLPAPIGKPLVGRQITTWVDTSRTETLGGSGGPRKIAVWIWYPAAHAEEGTPAPYMPAEWVKAREADRGVVGSLFFQSIASIQSHAVEGVPIEA